MPGELPARTEVAILGGGFAGCATAWALAARGIRGLVLEREASIGQYASGRSAGLGRQLAEDDETTALTVRGAALLRERFPQAWRETGGLLSFDDAAQAEAYVARAQRHRVPFQRVTRTTIEQRWPVAAKLDVAAALYCPTDGVIDVRVLLAAFAADAHVAVDAKVTAVEAGRVVTTRGTVVARTIVDATGAWAGRLVGVPALAAFKRHVFVVEAQAGATTPYLWHVGARELYVRPAADGVMTSPCDAELTAAADQTPDADADRMLYDRLALQLPALADARVVRRWACQRAFTPDRKMRLGRDPNRPWLVWAAGLGGHGATASAAVGEAVAAAVLAGA